MKKRILAVMMSMLMAAGSLPYGTAAYGGELELVAEPTDLAFQEGIQDADEGSLIEEGFEGSGDIPEISSQPETSVNPEMDAEGLLSDALSDDGVYEPEESNGMEATDEGFGLLLEESETETEPVSGLGTGPDEGNAGDGLETVPDSVMISTEVFPDEHFRGYVEEHCDTDGDGILSRAEIDSITEIHVPSLSISSLQGIECFPQLKALDCSSNLLTSLDLSGLPYLESLDCSDNQLATLDLSGNAGLRQAVISPQTVSAIPEIAPTGWMITLPGLAGADQMGRISFPLLSEAVYQTKDGIAFDGEQVPDRLTYMYDTGLQIDGEAVLLEVDVRLEALEEVIEGEEDTLSVSTARQECTVLSLGDDHSAVVKADGSLWMWGSNGFGKLGDGSTADYIIRPVKVMDGVKAVSLGENHSAAIKTDGSLWMWGRNSNGQLGTGDTVDRNTPVKVMDGVKAVSLGASHSAAIKTDGSLWMWGDNEYGPGQLGDGSKTDRYTPVKVMEGVQAVSLGGHHSAAIKTDGSLWMWGDDESGQLGIGVGNSYSMTPMKVMDGVWSVSLGYEHSAAIKTDGSLWMWGNNWRGQLGTGDTIYRIFPIKVLDNVQDVSLGNTYSAAIKTDGSLWVWGSNSNGELGTGDTVAHNTPVKVMDDVKAVCLSKNPYADPYSAAVKADGSLWMWGVNGYGQLGDRSMEDRITPVQVLQGKEIDASVENPPGNQGGTGNENTMPADIRQECTVVSLGERHSAAIKADGSLWMWGDNRYGQLGDGSRALRRTPVKVMDGVKAVSLGYDHSAAIKTDGSLWMWGYNKYGQLGDGSKTDRFLPVKVMDGVKAVSLGASHSAAIKTDGSLWMWGDDYHDQLFGIRACDTPTKVMGDVSVVSLGLYHSAAIKTDGSLWLCGNNMHGQIGDGTKTDRKTSAKVMDGVKAVSLGSYHSAAIKADGSLWTWGYNGYSQLGDGSKTDRFLPVKVIDDVHAVSLGNHSSAAVKADGSLWTWGAYVCKESQGAFDVGKDIDSRDTPVKVLDGVQDVSLGNYLQSAAVKTDGSLWMWGYNGFSQLGDGTQTARAKPVKVLQNLYQEGGATPHTHVWGSWKTVKQATALTQGKKERTCQSCGQKETKKIAKLKATIKVNATTVILQVGQSTSKLKVSGLAKGDTVESWKSADTKIAAVGKKGKITAKNKAGKTTVTITLKSGLKKKITVKVQKNKVMTSKITGVKGSLSLKIGKTKKLSPVLSPITSSDKVTYSSSNKKVATVSSNGKITAKKKGTATITVKSGKATVTCKVTVK